jgi:spermidine synthase
MLAKRPLIALALGLGYLSTNTQVIILRELLVAFTGNELILAITLAVWLLSIAAGTFIFKRPAANGRPAIAGLLFIIAGTLAVFQAVLVRCLDPLAATFGEILSPLAVIALSAACITPVAMLLGGLFVALVALAAESKEITAVPVIYGYEAVGSALAGAVLSLFMLGHTNSLVGLGTGGLVGLGCGGFLILGARRATGRIGRVLLTLSLAAVIVVLVLNKEVDLSTRRIQWKPLDVVRSVETRYGSIVVTGRSGTFDFFETGNLSHTIPDPLYAEEGAHIPMLYHPAPESVLVIGGAGSGLIAEVIKHPTVRSVDFVELDPEIIRLTRQYAPAGWLEGSSGTSVRPVYGDGRRFITTADRRYDVVIIGVGVPVTLQTTRYYTVEFLTRVSSRLSPDGVLAFKIPSGGAYVSPELGMLLSTLKTTCRLVFDEVELLPGEYIHILASPELHLDTITDSLPDRLAARGIRTSFVDEYHLFDRLLPMRRSQLDSVTAGHGGTVANSDFRPVSASYAIARWAKHFESGRLLAAATGWMSQLKFIVSLLVSALIVVPLLMRAAGSPGRALSVSLALYSVGLTSMFTQVVIIAGFQIVSGYLYGWIAALIASFMLGMGLASALAGSRRLVGRPRQVPFLMTGLIILPLAALLTLRFAGSLASGGTFQLADLLFAVLAFAAGALGGVTFALASSLITHHGRGTVTGGALAYALDLCGATVAGFTTAFLAIPSLGIAGSAYAVAIFNAVLLAVILVVPGRSRGGMVATPGNSLAN